MSGDVSTDVPEDPVASRPRRGRSSGSGLLAGLGVALLLSGAGGMLIAAAYSSEPHVEARGTTFVVDAGAGDPRDIAAHNSPTIARNPRNPDELAIADRIDTPAYSCALHVSSDAGVSWRPTPLPVPKGEEPKCYAPDVAFGADGTLYVAYVTLAGLGNVPHAVWVASSTDGGRTLSAPVRALGELAFQVRLRADPTVPRLVYLTYLHADEVGLYRFSNAGNPIEIVRSADGGRTWAEPVRVSDGRRARALAPTPAIGPRGEVYVCYLDLGEDRLDYEGAHRGRGGPPYRGVWSLILARSRDRGATWAESTVATRIVPTRRFIAFIPPSPALAIDPGGRRIYAAYTDGSLGDPDVRLWRSTDGGGRWAQIRVNDTPARDGRAQYLPQVAVAPGGRVDVVYYDRRDDRANVRNGVSLQSSFDGARSFGPRVRLTRRPFDSRIGPGSAVGLADLGSRLALLSTRERAVAVWSDTSAGTPASGKQDLRGGVATVVRPARAADGVRALLRFGGLALALVGLVLIGRWAGAAAARRRSRAQRPDGERGRTQAV